MDVENRYQWACDFQFKALMINDRENARRFLFTASSIVCSETDLAGEIDQACSSGNGSKEIATVPEANNT